MSGALVGDDLVRDILESALISLQQKGVTGGIIFDGYPRNLKQAASLRSTLERINAKR
jgi:adenylate kinase family enzyme